MYAVLFSSELFSIKKETQAISIIKKLITYCFVKNHHITSHITTEKAITYHKAHLFLSFENVQL